MLENKRKMVIKRKIFIQYSVYIYIKKINNKTDIIFIL